MAIITIISYFIACWIHDGSNVNKRTNKFEYCLQHIEELKYIKQYVEYINHINKLVDSCEELV